MKVAHLIATNFFGGPEKQILEHARRLRGGTVDLCVLSYMEGPENQFLRRASEEGIEAHGLPLRSPFDPRGVSDLTHLLAHTEADLLVTHHYKAAVLGRVAAWRLGLPVVTVSRGWTGESLKIRLYERLDKIFLRFADRVVAVSEGQKRKILALGIPEDKITVIRNCIDPLAVMAKPRRPLRRELGVAPDTLLVASAGRLSPEKNYGGLVRAAVRVLQGIPDCVFVVFGEGVLRGVLEKLVAENGLSDRFLFPGFRSDFPAILPEIDLFVLPSFTEGLPNVVLEAFAARRPVVATAVGGTPEVVEEGVNGFLVSPEEEEKMAARIRELLQFPDLRRQYGEAGFRTVCQRFSPQAQAEEYRRLYFQMVSAGGGRFLSRGRVRS